MNFQPSLISQKRPGPTRVEHPLAFGRLINVSNPLYRIEFGNKIGRNYLSLVKGLELD